MAPLSRYRNPNSLATILAKVLFPVEEKPSTAIIISGTFIVLDVSLTNIEKYYDICTSKHLRYTRTFEPEGR
jgi:hypothetical protein